MSAKSNVRESALTILELIEKNQAYSNLLLNNVIKKNEIDKKDIGLLTELTYGTLQRKLTLDYYLQPFLKKNQKLESWVKQLLRLTLYQMLYLDRIPDRAAIFEAVEIAKRRGHKGISSLVNGVLRSIQREGVPSLEAISDPLERLALETSHPLWLVKMWANELGFEETKEMCAINLTAPLQTGRVNFTRISRAECLSMLVDEGFQVEESPIIPEAIRCLKGNLANSQAFKDGYVTIQDESSMLVAYAVGAQIGEHILDACAAPGGKSTHLAEKLANSGRVVALDLHEHKVKLIAENAQRLHLTNLEVTAMDSRNAPEFFAKESFDRILIDAPCSGLGVLRRKPDVKYTKAEEQLQKLQHIQLTLLNSLAPLLKKGGILVYSTCTVNGGENNQVVDLFLEEHKEFTGDQTLIERLPSEVSPLIKEHSLQVLPQNFGSDGFYIACLKKSE